MPRTSRATTGDRVTHASLRGGADDCRWSLASGADTDTRKTSGSATCRQRCEIVRIAARVRRRRAASIGVDAVQGSCGRTRPTQFPNMLKSPPGRCWGGGGGGWGCAGGCWYCGCCWGGGRGAACFCAGGFFCAAGGGVGCFGRSGAALTMVCSGPLQSVSQIS